MRAWIVQHPSPIDQGPLREVERDEPIPGPTEVRVRVRVCGICRTDLHLAEGDLTPRHPASVPGHEIVGTVEAMGRDARRFELGERIGIAWLRRTCGACRFCRRGAENLCVDPRFTGWDADGGFAELAVVDEHYAYSLPDSFSDVSAAPLLCAGIIGYRALRRADLPTGGRLGIYGFGASAHITAQVALAAGATVHVMTRSPAARRLAIELGSTSAGDTFDPPPEPLDSAIVFAPAGDIVPAALESLDRGGTLAIAGIHMTDIPALDYQRHLFQERQIRSVSANTRRDGEEFLALAGRIGLHVTTSVYAFDDAGRALADLASDRIDGAGVLRVSDPGS